MATEMVEYRPGKWVKVVDGRIVGRATAEELAAWQAEMGSDGRDTLAPPAPLTLDVDLDPSPRGSAEPARALEVPLRPAFERRGRAVRPAIQSQPAPAPDEERGAESRPSPSRATLQPRPQPPAEEVEEPSVIHRRRTAGAIVSPSSEEIPVPKSQLQPPVEPAAQPPAEGSEAELPAEELSLPSPNQDVSYWWIWNVHRQPMDAFLREWVPKYQAKFGHPVTVILCHEEDLAAVQACGFEASASPLLRPGHFYLGHGNGNKS